MRLETKQLILCETDEMEWKILLKDSLTPIGRMSVDKLGDVVKMRSLFLSEKQNPGIIEEILEALCNITFYRLNARKLLVSCQCGDDVSDEAYALLGFHCEMAENQRGECEKQYLLYKEEYVAWLRKHGKALSGEKLNSMKGVFLVVAMLGVCLLGLDMIRKVNTLMTSLYAYITGIGIAGAIASSFLSAKYGVGQKDGDDANAG